MDILTDTPEKLSRLGEKLAASPMVGLDYETTSDIPGAWSVVQFDRLKPVGWGFGFPDGNKTYVPIAHGYGTNLPYELAVSQLRKVLKDKNKVVWAHNAKFEQRVTRALRIDAQCQWQCSMIAQWLCNRGLQGGKVHRLKPTVKKYLKHKMLEWGDVVPGNMRAHQIQSSTMAPYCADDALQGLKLGEFFMQEIRELGMEYVFLSLEMPFIEVLVHMDEVGFAIDRKYLYELYEQYNAEMKKLAIEFLELTDVSIASAPAISKAMFDELKWWPIPKDFERGKSGNFSIDTEHRAKVRYLLEENSPGFKAMNLKDRYQTIQKIVTTYTTSLINRANKFTDKRLRSDWIQQGTATGRLASASPNFQNLPIRTADGRKVRGAFVSEEGWELLDKDYSQADLRMMAHLAKDPFLMKAYIEDVDIHQQTATACGCDRPTGKVINLGLIYEMSPYTLANRLKLSNTKGEMYWNRWHKAYPKVRPYHSRMHEYARKHGYVKTITGRIRRIPDIKSKVYKKRRFAERTASNTPDQGSVADVIKIAMRNVYQDWKERGVLYDWFKKTGKVKLLSQVHDELICEVREDFKEEAEADLTHHMEHAVKLRVPMKTEGGFGRTWLEAH